MDLITKRRSANLTLRRFLYNLKIYASKFRQLCILMLARII